MTTTAAPTPRSARRAAFFDRTMSAKVPHVAAAFWGVKLLTTGMGEAMSDFIASLAPVLAVVVLLALLGGTAVLFWKQLTANSYHPVRYWSTIAMIAIFGTMAADVVHVVLGNIVTTIGYAAAVAGVLFLWHRSEGSISIHSITTPRRELFYWATVAATFALGTAAGDFVADTLHLGYGPGALVFGVLMLVLLAAWRGLHLAAVPVFWAAYVLTRPLGASLADWFGKPHPKGLDLGDGVVSGICLVVFAGLMVWLQRTGHDAPRADEH